MGFIRMRFVFAQNLDSLVRPDEGIAISHLEVAAFVGLAVKELFFQFDVAKEGLYLLI